MCIRDRIVDDEPTSVNLLKTVIEKKCDGFQVTEIAYDGTEAMEKLKGVQPDILITDIQMQVMSGLEPVSYTHLDVYKRQGTMSVALYIILGAVGVPVFAGMTGGIGILTGTTGGYIVGFLFSALVMWAMEKIPGKKSVIQILSMAVGLIVCYAFGTVWFMAV